MGEFFIGDTNFGVQETSESCFVFRKIGAGQMSLFVEICGNKEIFENICADEGSEWRGMQDPPCFYLRDHTVSEMPSGETYTINLTPNDPDVEVGLYWMEHNNVEDVILKLTEGRVEVSGSADVMGEPRDFQIRWDYSARNPFQDGER